MPASFSATALFGTHAVVLDPDVVVPVVLVFDVDVPVVELFVVEVSVVVLVLAREVPVVVVAFFGLFEFVVFALVPAVATFFPPPLVGLDEVFTGFVDDVFTDLADEVVGFWVVAFEDELLGELDDTLTGFDAGPRLPA